MFEKLNKFFRLGLYTKAQLHKFVEKGVITEEQYQHILAICDISETDTCSHLYQLIIAPRHYVNLLIDTKMHRPVFSGLCAFYTGFPRLVVGNHPVKG